MTNAAERALRLLDHIAHCTAPFTVLLNDGTTYRLPGTSDFAPAIQRCPLRYVLTDDLTRMCVALAYSSGDELSGCLDLLRFPAQQMWIEWNDDARRCELAQTQPQFQCAAEPRVLRAGTLIHTDPDGHSGRLRTFWLTADQASEPILGAVETLIDFRHGIAGGPADSLLEGHIVKLRDSESEPVDNLLQCAGFRLEPLWRAYYSRFAGAPATRARVIEQSLSTVAFDIPIVLALLLLMSLRSDLIRTPTNLSRLNAKRARLGKRALLEHIEVSAPVFPSPTAHEADGVGSARRGPRFHHVRGHIVRRQNSVYWRGPHWRGHVRLGTVRTRTVELRLPT